MSSGKILGPIAPEIAVTEESYQQMLGILHISMGSCEHGAEDGSEVGRGLCYSGALGRGALAGGQPRLLLLLSSRPYIFGILGLWGPLAEKRGTLLCRWQRHSFRASSDKAQRGGRFGVTCGSFGGTRTSPTVWKDLAPEILLICKDVFPLLGCGVMVGATLV
ncbi:hypothetical protein GOP47_0007265 [Adiantum capillus-veneris]|uniref:Uncharacterized protein n=1 Tax=Adiantum capillus-veneris TaxID=13818 RepID=A0A9D4ZLC9_ADICA|nr:hypothetical protein GOP47_0007265 [Adiantum capillus-veneris]